MTRVAALDCGTNSIRLLIADVDDGVVTDLVRTMEIVRLGQTHDDAAGECFDKSARVLGLPYPGGAPIDRLAKEGRDDAYTLPHPFVGENPYDMSFSGLKTAVLRARDGLMAGLGGLRRQDRADLCAAFQRAVADVLVEKSRRALTDHPVGVFAVAGGVAANTEIRARLTALCEGLGVTFLAPPLRLCTDNAAMIAWAGIEQFRLRGADDLTLSARPRWPLDQKSPALIGSGKKGAKA